MGVEYSSYLGYGFKLSPETVEYLKGLDTEGVGLYEFLWDYLPETLDVVEAGTMYDDKPNEYIVSVKRLTRDIDYEEGARHIRLDAPLLEAQEAHDLFQLHEELEARNDTPVGSFYAGLWH